MNQIYFCRLAMAYASGDTPHQALINALAHRDPSITGPIEEDEVLMVEGKRGEISIDDFGRVTGGTPMDPKIAFRTETWLQAVAVCAEASLWQAYKALKNLDGYDEVRNLVSQAHDRMDASLEGVL